MVEVEYEGREGRALLVNAQFRDHVRRIEQTVRALLGPAPDGPAYKFAGPLSMNGDVERAVSARRETPGTARGNRPVLAVTDTHSLLWHANGRIEKLGPRARDHFARTDRRKTAVCVPTFVLAEVGGVGPSRPRPAPAPVRGVARRPAWQQGLHPGRPHRGRGAPCAESLRHHRARRSADRRHCGGASPLGTTRMSRRR